MPNTFAEIITAVGSIVTPVAVAWIAFQQVKLAKSVNGKMAQLLEVTGAKERAEGKDEGKKEQRAEAKEDTLTSVVDVKIVDQDKVIKVVTEKPK